MKTAVNIQRASSHKISLQHVHNQARRCLVLTRASGGFGKASPKRSDKESSSGFSTAKPSPRIAKELGLTPDPKDVINQTPDFAKGWRNLGEVSTLFSNKNVKAVEVGTKAYVLYKNQEKVFCSDALSTAFKYPLVDAKILDGADGRPVIEVPLDGTQYDLETGKVTLWCPKTDAVRTLLGALKKDTPAEDLKMYDIKVHEGKVFAWLYAKMA